ncbi:hypothetical protein [Hydrogenovibrio kuenenii]|uniref:hypothetical protein n=1 Tax=Hydrogenovibrio kuenenii TaxID=63658 RepID=UPI0004B14D38|nr:hypothetical protein [Hydrogenovibrio kuenenii]
MNDVETEKRKLIKLLEQLEDKESQTQIKLSKEQTEQLARVIKKLLKQQLH